MEGASLQGNNKLGSDSNLNGTYFGKGSYCGKNCDLENVKILNYTSIASDVKIINGNHPTRIFVTTHPFSYGNGLKKIGFGFLNKRIYEGNRFKENNYSVVIENDVWIGEHVRILNGVKIGNGAIIGTGSIVVKDVPPYAIAVGVPARVIKYRFSEKEIEFLEKFKWWDKDIKWIKENINLFSDINSFIKVYDNNL